MRKNSSEQTWVSPLDQPFEWDSVVQAHRSAALIRDAAEPEVGKEVNADPG
ncbi:hypothetical protein HispidOSU_011429, partial [Sigmodon hispidus]